MQTFYHVIIVLEMLTVNLTIFTYCARRKKSLGATIFWLALFSLALVGGLMPFLQRLPGYGNGNGLFLLFGLVYFFPLQLLVDQPAKQTVIICCAVWNYTILLFSLAAQLSLLLPAEYFALAVAVIQSLLYLFTLPTAMKFVKTKVSALLTNMLTETAGHFLWLSVIYFLLVILIHFALVMSGIRVVNIAIVLLLCVIAVLNYRLLFKMVFAMKKAQELHQGMRTDSLTQLKNRISFYEQAQLYRDKNIPFTLFYIDLDDFKQVNDRFGHLIGDQYLTHFAQYIQAALTGWGTLFRISGDEFIFLYNGNHPETFQQQVENMSVPDFNVNIPFYGYSMGSATYRGDEEKVDELIRRADQSMYMEKRKKHRERE